MLASLRHHFGTSSALAGAGALGAAYWFSQQSGSGPSLLPISQSEKASAGALDPDNWKSFKLRSKEQITHDTLRFRFDLPDKDQVVGLPVASCFVTRAPIGDDKEDGTKKFVIRPYTPCSDTDTKGHFDMVIKGYPQGKMSQHIHHLSEGEELECKGPIMKLEYKPNMKKKLGMIAGGSGLTPMLQIIQEVVKNPEDKTEVSFIFANKTEDDIILRKELDELAAQHDNLKLHYVVDTAPNDRWKGGVGHVTADTVRAQLPPPDNDNLILVCGPPPMMKAMSGDKVSPKDQGEVAGILKEVGYSKAQVYKF